MELGRRCAKSMWLLTLSWAILLSCDITTPKMMQVGVGTKIPLQLMSRLHLSKVEVAKITMSHSKPTPLKPCRIWYYSTCWLWEFSTCEYQAPLKVLGDHTVCILKFCIYVNVGEKRKEKRFVVDHTGLYFYILEEYFPVYTVFLGPLHTRM